MNTLHRRFPVRVNENEAKLLRWLKTGWMKKIDSLLMVGRGQSLPIGNYQVKIMRDFGSMGSESLKLRLAGPLWEEHGVGNAAGASR